MTALSYLPLDPPVMSGAHYFTVSELRDEQDLPPTYPDVAVTPNRALAEEVIEQACGVAFIPRRRVQTTTLTPDGHPRLTQPKVREIESVVEVEPGIVTVTYTHGYDLPPARIRRAAMTATRVWTTKGPVDDRATQIAADGATVNLATPGLSGSVTGIPEVDAALRQYDHRALVG